MASEHGVIRSAVSNAASSADGAWLGKVSIVTQAGANISGIQDSSAFTSRIIRASNRVILTPANSTAAKINRQIAATSHVVVPWATLTNNASILIRYNCPAAFAGETATFYFQVFSGGTAT